MHHIYPDYLLFTRVTRFVIRPGFVLYLYENVSYGEACSAHRIRLLLWDRDHNLSRTRLAIAISKLVAYGFTSS